MLPELPYTILRKASQRAVLTGGVSFDGEIP
jgi:hypothetical protein